MGLGSFGCGFYKITFTRLVFFRRLEAETDEALKEQDEKLGKILGKLQVS